MSIKVVHTADVHIGMRFENASFSGDFSKIRHDEIKETFYNIIKYTKETCADFLIVAGDLFENDYVKRSDLKELSRYCGGLQSAVKHYSRTKVVIASIAKNEKLLCNSCM